MISAEWYSRILHSLSELPVHRFTAASLSVVSSTCRAKIHCKARLVARRYPKVSALDEENQQDRNSRPERAGSHADRLSIGARGRGHCGCCTAARHIDRSTRRDRAQCLHRTECKSYIYIGS